MNFISEGCRSNRFPVINNLKKMGDFKSPQSFVRNYSRTISNLFPEDHAIHRRNFYQIPPTRKSYLDTMETSFNVSENVRAEVEVNPKGIINHFYSLANGSGKSFLATSIDPKKVWNVVTKNPLSDNKEKESIFSSFSSSEPIPMADLEQLLKEKGGAGLSRLPEGDLIRIWKQFKEQNRCNKIVELFHSCFPCSFTASPLILLDYCYAHLRSCYSHPLLVETFAKKILEKQEYSKAHYLLGLSHMARAYVAKSFGDVIAQGKEDCELGSLYGRYFKGLVFAPPVREYQKSLKSAESAFKKAFDMEINGPYSLALILNLVEQGNLAEAETISGYVWAYLNRQPSLTTQEIQTLIIAGIIGKKSSPILEMMTYKMLAKEPEITVEFLENLNLLSPYFSTVEQLLLVPISTPD